MDRKVKKFWMALDPELIIKNQNDWKKILFLTALRQIAGWRGSS